MRELIQTVRESMVTFEINLESGERFCVSYPLLNMGSRNAIKIVDVGNRKIQVIKLVREFTGCGLMEAKNRVENLPCTIREDELKPGKVLLNGLDIELRCHDVDFEFTCCADNPEKILQEDLIEALAAYKERRGIL